MDNRLKRDLAKFFKKMNKNNLGLFKDDKSKIKDLEKIEEEEKNKIMNENKIKEENEIINNYERNEIVEKEIIDPNSIILDRETIEKMNRSEIESRNKLNNEIYRLRAQMQDQQMLL